MTLLSAFGLFAVTAMLVTYAPEARSDWFILAFACALGSICTKRLVHFGVRMRMRIGIDLRIPSGRMAVRPG
jgi:hypothetical protein